MRVLVGCEGQEPGGEVLHAVVDVLRSAGFAANPELSVHWRSLERFVSGATRTFGVVEHRFLQSSDSAGPHADVVAHLAFGEAENLLARQWILRPDGVHQ